METVKFSQSRLLGRLKQLSIPGLFLSSDYITPAEENLLLDHIDKKPWINQYQRRIQIYGRDYRSGLENNVFEGLSGPLAYLANYLAEDKIIISPNQCVVNEYTRKQGIGAHTDNENVGYVIAGISLGGAANIIFSRPGYESVKVFLPQRSIFIMLGDARWLWKHEIPRIVSYTDDLGIRHIKSEDYRRVSITYREIPSGPPPE